MTRFLRCGLLLAVLLAWAVDAWLKPAPKPQREVPVLFPHLRPQHRERKPSDECSDYAAEKAHPNWFACPIDEQKMTEM